MAEDAPLADEVREQDRFLPVANISRIMKRALPSNAKVAKDAKDAVQECVSEFISFVTSEGASRARRQPAASDKCLQEKRKTINGDDLLWAMSTLGFDRYVEPLKIYLAKYREARARAARARRPRARTSPSGGTCARSRRRRTTTTRRRTTVRTRCVRGRRERAVRRAGAGRRRRAVARAGDVAQQGVCAQ